jgi:hypothetical protein
MNTRILTCIAAVVVGGMAVSPAHAAGLDCKLHFDLNSWSVIYKHAEGKGVVTCTDGQTMNVTIKANGGGLTVGKAKIKDGIGNFTDIQSIDDIPGTYAQADASIGVPKSGDVQVLTKGKVSMAIAGAGRGFGMGVSVGGFTITQVK